MAAPCPGGGGLPMSWTDVDVGVTGATGCASYDGTTYTLQGAGGGTYLQTADSFHFASRSFSGDFEFIAKLETLTGPGAPYAGVMIRPTTGSGSRFIQLYQAAGDSGLKVGSLVRLIDNEQSTAGNYKLLHVLPGYQRIIRYKDQVSVYASQDAVTWTWVEGMTLNNLSSSVQIGLMVTSQASGQLATATFKQVTDPPSNFTPPYATSWIGNSYGGGSTFIQQDIAASFTDPVTARTYANVYWDEGFTEAGIYDSNGLLERKLQDTHSNWHLGGYAVTASASHVYLAMEQQPWNGCLVAGSSCCEVHAGYPPCGTIWHVVRRYDLTGKPDWSGGSGPDPDYSMLVVMNGGQPTTDHIRGLSVNRNANELYVSDAAAGKIHVYNSNTMVFLRDLTLARPRASAWDNGSNIWVIQAADANNAAKVLKIRVSDGAVQKTITGVTTPTAVAVASDNKVWVADNGPDQRIKIYTSNGGSSPWGTFGDLGGILSGTKGEVVSSGKKFNGPIGVGLVGSNIYVIGDGPITRTVPPTGRTEQGTGTEMRKFNTIDASQPAWSKYGLEFIDSADADPATDGTDVFTKEAHYVMNYAQPTGQQWTYKGMTLDRAAYPQDMRLHAYESTPSGVFVRRINGARILYVATLFSSYLGIYRFTSGSEIAIPCSVISSGHPANPLSDWPVNAPSGRWIWRDGTVANGLMEAGEFESIGPWAAEIWGWQVDSNGDIWSTADGGSTPIQRYARQSTLDVNGCPVYQGASITGFAKPDLFVDNDSDPNTATPVQRVQYDSATHTMYLGGFTHDRPQITNGGLLLEFGNVGTEVVRYDNWDTCAPLGNCVPTWRITDLPYSAPYEHVAKCLSVAGGRVFVGIQDTAEIRMYDTANGLYTGSRIPGAEVAGKSSWLDNGFGMNAFKRTSGEILLFAEDDLQAKVIFYRITP